jgi:hypothetical protein
MCHGKQHFQHIWLKRELIRNVSFSRAGGSAQRDPDPTGFGNPEYRPSVGIRNFEIRDPESIRQVSPVFDSVQFSECVVVDNVSFSMPGIGNGK